MLGKESKKYLSSFINVNEELEQKITKHMHSYKVGEICAWYKDWEDFCSDWCSQCGYTKTQARKLLHGGIGEFMILPDNLGIIRFVI